MRTLWSYAYGKGFTPRRKRRRLSNLCEGKRSERLGSGRVCELDRSLQPERRRLVRTARIVAWAGAYAGITGALALAVYGALRWAQ